MSDKDNSQDHGLFTDPSTFHPEVSSIPLTGADTAEGRKKAGIGDLVVVSETRPMSASKRWRLVEIAERAK